MKRKAAAYVLLALLVLGALFQNTLLAYGKSALLIAEVFPAIEVKPLDLVSAEPEHLRTTFPSARGTVVADLFLPQSRFGQIAPRSAPAVILAMGVRTQAKDRPGLLNLGRAMSRLGFVVVWPRLDALDREDPLMEEPSTFVAAYRYLENVDVVDGKRISFVGFSVGSSVAFVAATDEEIVDRVRGVVFFGGYFDMFDYLSSLVTQTAVCDGQVVSWNASSGAPDHLREILEHRGSIGVIRVFGATSRPEADAILRAAPRDEVDELRKVDPRERVDRFKARIFILHDEGDSYVPYCDAGRMKAALPARVQSTYLVVRLFEHVQPSGGITPDTLAEFGRLFGFLAAVFEYM